MPTSDGTASAEALDGQPTDSVFDFLYSDSARISSLLAQFDPSGHLTGAKLTEGREESSADKATGGTKGGVPGIIGGSASYEGSTGLRASETGERTYDPYWANARELLNQIAPRLVRDLAAARIGQLVVSTGHLAIADLSLFKNIWSLPAIKREVRSGMQSESDDSGNREMRRSQKGANAAAKKVEDENADAVMSMIGNLPHLITLRLQTPDGLSLYGNLRESGVVGTTHDLLLKHGMAISGQWTVVGIVDALPEILPNGEIDPDAAEAFARGRLMVGGIFGEILGEIVLPMRQLLGRPLDHYGVTPIMVFRDIAA